MQTTIASFTRMEMAAGSRLPVAFGLGLLMAVALVVRLFHLTTDPIWFDEAASLGIASMDWSIILGPMAEAESSPPGYYVLAKLWMQLFGDNIVSLRMMSVLAGAASVAVIWAATRHSFSETAAWIAAGFITLAATQVRLSQDGRCYAILFLIATLAIWAAMTIVRRLRDGNPWWWQGAALSVSMAFMLWLHATAGFIILGLNALVLTGLLPERRLLWRGLAGLAVVDTAMVVLAALPLWAIMQHALFSDSFVDRWIEPEGLIDVLRMYGRNFIAPFLGPFSPVAALLQGSLLLAAAWLWWRTGAPMILALATMLVVSSITLPVVSQFIPVLLPRTALFLLAPLAILLGVGAASLPRRLMRCAAGLLLGLQAVGVIGWHRLEVRTERWDQAAEVLQRKMRAGEPIIMTESAFLEISLTASLRQIDAPVPRMVLVPPRAPMEELAADALDAETITPDQALGALLTRSGTVWLVMRDQPTSVENDEGFSSRQRVRRALTAAGGLLAERITMPGVEIERWTVRPR